MIGEFNTSIQERIFTVAKTLKKAQKQGAKAKPKKSKQPTTLYPFLGAERQTDATGIAYLIVDDFGLIDWTGRAIRSDKKGAIPPHIQPLLEKLSINEEAWLQGVKASQRFYRAA